MLVLYHLVLILLGVMTIVGAIDPIGLIFSMIYIKFSWIDMGQIILCVIFLLFALFMLFIFYISIQKIIKDSKKTNSDIINKASCMHLKKAASVKNEVITHN